MKIGEYTLTSRMIANDILIDYDNSLIADDIDNFVKNPTYENYKELPINPLGDMYLDLYAERNQLKNALKQLAKSIRYAIQKKGL